MSINNIIVTDADAGNRIDVFLSRETNITRAFAEKLLSGGFVTLCGKPLKKNYRLRGGETLSVCTPEPTPDETPAENIPLDIVYEDDCMLVVNKPKGMVVHPAAGNRAGTLVNALLAHCGESLSGIGGVMRPGIVHRIDKETSGLLLVAKNDVAHLSLSAQIKAHTAARVYNAILLGNLREDEGKLDYPIGRDTVNRKKMAVTSVNSKPAVTNYRVLERFYCPEALTLVECRLETGRTHQIRVHFSYIGHPVLGDAVYGSLKDKRNRRYASGFEGQCLHASEISFCHPITGERMRFFAPLPKYFSDTLDKLKKITD